MSRSPCLQFSSLQQRGTNAKSPSHCWQFVQTLLRGGGAKEPEALSCDAMVDVGMFLSEFGDEDEAARTRNLIPAKIAPTGRLEDGQMATAALTAGDGACSLHSLWGNVKADMAGNMYYRKNAREKLLKSMPTDVTRILTSPCGPALRDIFDQHWRDLELFVKDLIRDWPHSDDVAQGVAVIWKHLPSSHQTMLVSLKTKYLHDKHALEILMTELTTACASFFPTTT